MESLKPFFLWLIPKILLWACLHCLHAIMGPLNSMMYNSSFLSPHGDLFPSLTTMVFFVFNILFQLLRELKKGRAFDGWSEGTLNFPPTYKYEFNSDKYFGEDPKAGRRTPAWYADSNPYVKMLFDCWICFIHSSASQPVSCCLFIHLIRRW